MRKFTASRAAAFEGMCALNYRCEALERARARNAALKVRVCACACVCVCLSVLFVDQN